MKTVGIMILNQEENIYIYLHKLHAIILCIDILYEKYCLTKLFSSLIFNL